MKNTRSQRTLIGRSKNAFYWLIGEKTKLQRRTQRPAATQHTDDCYADINYTQEICKDTVVRHHFCCLCCVFPFALQVEQKLHRETHPLSISGCGNIERGYIVTMQTEEQRTVFDKHHKDIGRANDFIRSRWPRQPPSAEKLDMKSFVAWAVSTTQNSTVLLFAIGLDSVFTHNTYSRNPRNPWLIYQFAEENEALAKHIAETWQGMQVPNGQRGRVDQIAKHVIYEYEDSFTLIPLECDADANVRVRIKDINIWSHPPRDEPLRRKLEEDSRFKQTEGNLRAAAKQIKKIRDVIQIKEDQRDVRLQRQKSVVRQRFREYYRKYFCGLARRSIPHSYQFPTLQLALEQEGAPPDRYGNTMAGVYEANHDAVHHKFSASGIPRVLPSEEEVFDNWLKFPCGLTYAELFQGECF